MGVFHGSFLHYTWCNFEKLAFAGATLCLRAVLRGVVHDIMAPRYLDSWVVGPGSPSAKELMRSVGDLTRSSVFSLLRDMLYKEAFTSTACRNSCNLFKVTAIRAVSWAYSRSYTGFPTDQLLHGTP